MLLWPYMNLPKTYIAKDYEKNIYQKWLDSKCFEANPKSTKKHYSISLPPPNETGVLHVGHSLGLTLEDILIRHHRSLGYDVLWLPGTDHAAIATENVVEKILLKEGSSKHKLGREQFINRTKQFVAGSRETINSQIKAMGASLDWSRSRYTLDDTLSRVVSEVFVKMYNDGLIYRGYRIVNWDPNLQTNVSDDEVEYIEEKAKLYTFQFGPFEISTARPEVKFADKYIVVNPKDKRYSKYKHLETFDIEWINGKVKATLIKDESVDPKFGTGAMTITPWHSQVDFDLALKYNLDKEQIIDLNGKLLDIAGEFKGMTINDARPKIVQKLHSKGLLLKVEDNYLHKLAVNSRGKGTIEPQIRLQWFIDVNKEVVLWKGQKKSFKQILQSVIREGDIKIIPKHFEKTYFNWINNLRDWCISRQIWWGHQLPVWYKDNVDKNEIYVGLNPPEDQTGWKRDQDTLDTWFSSSLWTFSTLIDQKFAKDYSVSLKEMLNQSLDFKTYHPTNVLETGWDIIFFWVARMILSTTYTTGQIPFKEVYLHGLIRSENGKKMSKSDPESNIDPLEVIEEYGADSLRLALIQGITAGRDIRLGKSKIITNRNFCNKLWNVARYIEDQEISDDDRVELKSEADHWIISRLNLTSKGVIKDLNNYRFSDAYHKIYHFLRDELADWYIEASKVQENPNLLKYILKNFLITCHPIAPFITEAIWQSLDQEDLLALKTYKEIIEFDSSKAQNFERLVTIVKELRLIKKSLDIKKLAINSSSGLINRNFETIKKLVRIEKLEDGASTSNKTLTIAEESFTLNIDNTVFKKYLSDLEIKKGLLDNFINNLNKRLQNRSYLDKAPEELIEESRKQLQDALKDLELINSQIIIIKNS